jgi:hypothetical protein
MSQPSQRNPIVGDRRRHGAEADLYRGNKQAYSREHVKLDQHPDLEVHQAAASEDFRQRMAQKLSKIPHDASAKSSR